MLQFFRIVKDFEWRKCEAPLSRFQASTHWISPSIRDSQENDAACRSKLLSIWMLKSSRKPLRYRERERWRDWVFAFIHLPGTDTWYMINSVSSNNLLSLFFCQCTVLLKPVYIQPHDDAWLLTLIFFKCCADDFMRMTYPKCGVDDREVEADGDEVAVVDNDQKNDSDDDNDVILR